MRDRLLRNWARVAATHSRQVILVILILTVLGAVSASRIKMEMRWADLLPMGDPMAQEFDKVLKEYKSASTIIVVLTGDEAKIKGFADKVAPEIEKLKDYVERVEYKVDLKFFEEHGLLLTKAKDLKQSVELFEDLNLVPLLKSINDNFEQTYIEEEEPLNTREKEDNAVRYLDGLHYWLATMGRFIDGSGSSPALADSAVERFLLGDPYMISQDKRILLVNVKPTFSSMDVDKDIGSTVAIQKVLDKTGEDFPDVKAGITGMIPLQKDEMEYTTRDMKVASIIALTLVLILFILTFRMWSSPILAGLNLIISIVIAAGVVGVILGRLNLMTSMFAVILIGLGVDYSIHLIALYTERRTRDKDPVSAMEEALIRSGPGIITGALTTACAFFALAISVTQGIKEMGIVLGLGIICAMLITIISLPAFLVERERFISKLSKKPIEARHVEFTALENLGRIIIRKPVLFLIAGSLITGFMFHQALQVKFDYNMLNIEPKGLQTVALQDTIINGFDLSPDFAMVTTSSVEEAREITGKAKEMPLIGAVSSISEYLPSHSDQKERSVYLNRIRRIVSGARRRTIGQSDLDNLIKELERLDMNVYELSQMAFTGGQDRVDARCRVIIGDPQQEGSFGLIVKLIGRIKDERTMARRRLNLFQQYSFPKLKQMVYDMADPALITLETLPDYIKDRFVNEAGDRFLITFYPKGYIWNYRFLTNFTKQLERISPKITGTPPMFLRLINYIGRDGLRSTILTVFIVFILLWVDFRSLWLALLGIIPLIAGGIWMIGLLRSTGAMFNLVNVMGIPMIVGIGIDDGVHILHRYRFEGFDKTPVVLKSTGKAILLTSLTTMAGFGALMISMYRGFVSLGALLFLGVGACFVTTVIFLPAIISLFQRR